MKRLLFVVYIFVMMLCMHSYASARQGQALQEPQILQNSLELYPQDANLFMAENVVIEPANSPFNLGGWRIGDYVIFPLHVKDEGFYNVNLEYSKQAYDASTAPFAIIAATALTEQSLAGGSNLVVELPMTGNNWANYTSGNLGSLFLPKGGVFLILGAIPSEQERGQYVMNMRKLTLTRQQVDLGKQMKKNIDDAFKKINYNF